MPAGLPSQLIARHAVSCASTSRRICQQYSSYHPTRSGLTVLTFSRRGDSINHLRFWKIAETTSELKKKPGLATKSNQSSTEPLSRKNVKGGKTQRQKADSSIHRKKARSLFLDSNDVEESKVIAKRNASCSILSFDNARGARASVSHQNLKISSLAIRRTRIQRHEDYDRQICQGVKFVSHAYSKAKKRSSSSSSSSIINSHRLHHAIKKGINIVKRNVCNQCHEISSSAVAFRDRDRKCSTHS